MSRELAAAVAPSQPQGCPVINLLPCHDAATFKGRPAPPRLGGDLTVTGVGNPKRGRMR